MRPRVRRLRSRPPAPRRSCRRPAIRAAIAHCRCEIGDHRLRRPGHTSSAHSYQPLPSRSWAPARRERPRGPPVESSQPSRYWSVSAGGPPLEPDPGTLIFGVDSRRAGSRERAKPSTPRSGRAALGLLCRRCPRPGRLSAAAYARGGARATVRFGHEPDSRLRSSASFGLTSAPAARRYQLVEIASSTVGRRCRVRLILCR